MEAKSSDNRCSFWLPKKKRSCTHIRLEKSLFCGNHSQRLDGEWIPCPIDSSHSVLQENLEGHVKRCPLLKQTVALSGQRFYQKGINAGNEEEGEKMGSGCPDSVVVTSEMKRKLFYSMSVSKFQQLIKKIETVHGGICDDIKDSYLSPEACNIWFNKEVDRKLPFQEKHVLQQGSILGNLEEIGALKRSNKNVEEKEDNNVSAVVEFGAGRGYLTQMLADCYGIKKVYLVERKSYKLKADRSLRQKENLVLERMRIDIEDLNLNAVESLHGVPYVAVGKHLCGPATDFSLRCCLSRQEGESPVLRGLAIATCCHHLCQWKSYINKEYILSSGISKDEFHVMTSFTSWAVDDDHGSNLPGVDDIDLLASNSKDEEDVKEHSLSSVEEVVKKMKPMERAVLGFKCKQIIDAGRMKWVKKHGLDSKLVKYIPSSISPENTLLLTGKYFNTSRKWDPHAGPYLGEVSSLAFLNLPQHVSSIPYLLAGSGSDILLYNLSSGELIRSFQVFEGVRVHGTVCSSSVIRLADRYTYKLVVFGEKRVKIFHLVVELSSSTREISVNLEVFDSLPRLSNWVFDVCFLQDSTESLEQDAKLLAIGCSDNSVCIWDVIESRMAFNIQSPEKCLLYCMRLWGNSIPTLRIASGTIFNEIIVWRAAGLDGDNFDHGHYHASNMLRLTGHEGSIFRIVWSLDGSKLVSVSDDRSARIWKIDSQEVVGPVLFGHSVRVWDCCISDTLIVTAGEDCTCRVWSVNGTQLKVIKEHIGRGIWRCLYDPNSSLLVTAGFDSAIKVHQLHNRGSETLLDAVGVLNSQNKVESFTTCLPDSVQRTGLMDSKSEYVRCLQFTQEDTMYVATNHGCLYHARLLSSGNVRWTELIHIPVEGPIIAMDVMPGGKVHESYALDDWVALGDGKGNMTVVRVIGSMCNPLAGSSKSWKASPERQLLGAFWCKSLGNRFVFSCNPRGQLKLWKLSDPLASVLSSVAETYDVSLLAEFSSCFGMRIMCVDASVEDEVLVCGDIRGNITLFPLSKDMLNGVSVSSELKIPSLNYFKAAHGISTIFSLSVASLTSNKAEICSTGGDGCICYFEYDRERQTFEFMGLKQLKELSLVQSVCQGVHFSKDHPNCEYAAGFASTDFILWNLTDATKVAQISCGGWRRPHSFYLGDIPERQNCFAYVKDDVINIHRHWVGGQKTKIFPLNLNTQFHGRELHSLCFISMDTKAGFNSEELNKSNHSSWIATGCEDGSVRLTRYASEFGNWSTSELLGEHVGGSAVRSVYCVSNMHMIASGIPNLLEAFGKDSAVDDSESPCLLISVGAKRVLTSWLLRNGRQNEKKEPYISSNGHNRASSEVSSVTFQWLATDMPGRNSQICKKIETSPKVKGVEEHTSPTKSGSNSYHEQENYEDDWRYMAASAFLVKCIGSRLTICFIAVACSDATLTLRALVLPHRLWFDVASLVPLRSPILSLQHALVPLHPPHEGNASSSFVYLIISGATDGSIAFWDVTESVEAFVKQVSSIHIEKFIDCQRRPRTGRGSQGGRKWKLLGANISKRTQDSSNSIGEAGAEDLATSLELTNGVRKEDDKNESADSPPETSEIKPSHVVKNAHQSGVNCLHVSPSSSSPSYGNGLTFNVISGGDDQALHYLSFNILSSSNPSKKSEIKDPNQTSSYRLRLTDHGGIASAHSSAIKGVWMDANWVFSTGLDQRVRFWFLNKDGKLIEHSHIVISVPEPEALDAKAIDENRYQIVVAGRGIQMVEFSIH